MIENKIAYSSVNLHMNEFQSNNNNNNNNDFSLFDQVLNKVQSKTKSKLLT